MCRIVAKDRSRSDKMARNTSEQRSFEASLSPILIAAMPMGFRLNSRNKSGILPVIAWTFLLGNIVIHGLLTSVIVPQYLTAFLFYKNYTDLPSTFVRIDLIHLIQFLLRIIVMIAVPAVFTIRLYATGRWMTLWSTLLEIQPAMDLSRQFYRQCRNCSLASLSLLVLVRLTSLTPQFLKIKCLKSQVGSLSIGYEYAVYLVADHDRFSWYSQLMQVMTHFQWSTGSPEGRFKVFTL